MVASAGKHRAVVTMPSDTEIRIRREFVAPKQLVYKAWTTPALIKRWWSAKQGTVTSADVDLRVSGTWRWVMMTDRGFEVAFHGVYREIVTDERLVYTEIFEGMPGAAALTTMTFAESNGRTTLTSLVEHATKNDRDAHVNSGMEAGTQDAMDLLEQVVSEPA
jgi:uncharacterized protein YndB with AHSA1/START domain